MKIDRKTWLVDEDLLRADKMGMANGLGSVFLFWTRTSWSFQKIFHFLRKLICLTQKLFLNRLLAAGYQTIFKTAQKRLVFSWRKMAQKAGGAFKSQRSIIAELLQTDKKKCLTGAKLKKSLRIIFLVKI